MTTELPDLFAVNRLSAYGVSHLSDNVLILQYIRDESTIRRAITALKTRVERLAGRFQNRGFTGFALVTAEDDIRVEWIELNAAAASTGSLGGNQS